MRIRRRRECCAAPIRRLGKRERFLAQQLAVHLVFAKRVLKYAPPATSGTALSTVAANTAKTFVDGSGNVLMWDGLIAQALLNASQANGATLGAQVAQPADPTGKLALADVDNLLACM